MEEEKLKQCLGTHGGINKMCDSCAHNVENIAEGDEEEREYIEELLCRIKKPYWSQYKPIKLNG